MPVHCMRKSDERGVPSANHREADSLEGLRQVQNQGYTDLDLLLFALPLNISISINILLLPFRDFWCPPQSFPPTYQIAPQFSCLVSFANSKGTLGGSRPVFAFYNLDAFSNLHSLSLGNAFSIFFSSAFAKACPPCSARVRHIHYQCFLCPFFPLCLTSVQQPCILFLVSSGSGS